VPEIFTRPLSAGLLRVLAQAAAGYPNQGDMYFIARYEPDADGSFEVSPYTSLDEAGKNLEPLTILAPGEYDVFGPFDTALPFPPNPSQEKVSALHVQTTTAAGSAGTPFTLGDAGTLYDAVFISPAAVMKFAVPYYTRVYSPEFAETMLKGYLDSPVGMMVHLPWSEYGEDEDPAIVAWLPGIVLGDAETGYRVAPLHPPHPPRPDPAWPLA